MWNLQSSGLKNSTFQWIKKIILVRMEWIELLTSLMIPTLNIILIIHSPNRERRGGCWGDWMFECLPRRCVYNVFTICLQEEIWDASSSCVFQCVGECVCVHVCVSVCICVCEGWWQNHFDLHTIFSQCQSLMPVL